MNDKRIGNTKDGTEPEVCAVSGEPVQGRHNVQYMLGGGYFYRVLNKLHTKAPGETGDEPWRSGVDTQLKAVIVAADTPLKSEDVKKKGVNDVRSE